MLLLFFGQVQADVVTDRASFLFALACPAHTAHEVLYASRGCRIALLVADNATRSAHRDSADQVRCVCLDCHDLRADFTDQVLFAVFERLDEGSKLHLIKAELDQAPLEHDSFARVVLLPIDQTRRALLRTELIPCEAATRIPCLALGLVEE